MVTANGRGARALVLLLTMIGGMGTARAQEQPAVPNPPKPAENLPLERTISLRHRWTHEELTVVYRIGNGYQAEALAQLNWLLRDYRCSKYTTMDPKLIDLLYELQQELKPRGPIQIVSAYRSEGYNASLLRAGRTVDPDSQHTLGRAADVIFPGVPADQVRAAAEAHGIGGVGYYPFSGPVFVHVDTGPVRHWAERDPRVARAMGLHPPRRTRLDLDCSLTTEQVLEEIPPAQAYAALPPGAASKPHPASDVVPTSLDGAAPAFQSLSHGAAGNSNASPVSIREEEGPSCSSADPLAQLSLLPQPQPAPKKPAVIAKTQRIRQQAKMRLRQKVKRQVRSARRSATKPNRTATQDDRSPKPGWEKSAF